MKEAHLVFHRLKQLSFSETQDQLANLPNFLA